MTARTAAAAASFTLALTLVACTNFYEVPIETPIQPKMDVSPFQRVLIAGFLAGGSEDVDANLETVRLLRSQLRSKSSLRVIDADVLPLIDLANEQRDKPAAPASNGSDGGSTTTTEGTTPPQTPPPSTNGNGSATAAPPTNGQGTNGKAAQSAAAEQTRIKDEKDLQPLEGIFANVDFWKKIGEEYQNPLIVTGTVLFAPKTSNALVQRDQEVFDSFGRRRTVPTRTFMERKGFTLRPKFVFIDGRTGATMYSESYREEILYNAQQNTPALSSYFELMDRLVPNFLSALSSQKIKGTRVLLK